MRVTTIFAVSALLLGISVHAETPSRRDPLQGAKRVGYGITIGNSMDRQGDGSFRLFAGDHKQADDFERALVELLEQKFRRYGRTIAPDRIGNSDSHTLLVRVYGRPTDLEGCPVAHVFLLEMNMVERTTPDTWEDVWSHNELGVAEAGALKEQLLKSIRFGLDDLFWYEPVPVSESVP